MRMTWRRLVVLCLFLLLGASPLSRAEGIVVRGPSSRPVARKTVAASQAALPPIPSAASIKAVPETVADLRALQAQVEAVVKHVEPSVVGLRVGGGQGSGVIISEDGYVLTAGHVASAPGRDVTVVLLNGKTVKGKSLGVNYEADSGLVKISEPPPGGGKWPYVEMGDSSKLKKGQWCIVLGHPGGFKLGRTPPLRLGRVLDTRGKFIRTDCTLVGGDSGGPLFDLEGKVIGIHSRIGTSLNDNMHVPVDSFSDTWDRLAAGEAWGGTKVLNNTRPGGPYLGVLPDETAPDCHIAEIFPDSPAEKAGLKAGDLITSFDGQKVANFGELMLKIAAHKPGDEVRIEVKREGEKVKLSITIGRRPPER
jgi:serine protease Do